MVWIGKIMLYISEYVFGSGCNFLRRQVRAVILLLLLTNFDQFSLLFDCETLATEQD